MSWYDDMRTRIEQESKTITSNVEDFFKSQARDAVVKVGQEQLGNLSQLDLDRGKAGQVKPVADAAGDSSALNAIGASQISQNFMQYAPYILGAVVIYYIFSAKKSRG